MKITALALFCAPALLPTYTSAQNTTAAKVADVDYSHNGICRIDLSKSHYTSHPPPQSETVTTHSDAAYHYVDFDIVMSDGKPIKGGIKYPLAGGPVEEHGMPSDPNTDHVVAKRINRDKWTLTSFDKTNKAIAQRVITYHGSDAQATLLVDGKQIETEVCEMQ